MFPPLDSTETLSKWGFYISMSTEALGERLQNTNGSWLYSRSSGASVGHPLWQVSWQCRQPSRHWPGDIKRGVSEQHVSNATQAGGAFQCNKLHFVAKWFSKRPVTRILKRCISPLHEMKPPKAVTSPHKIALVLWGSVATVCYWYKSAELSL